MTTDLSAVFDDVLARELATGEPGLGLPPHCGGAHDLFADPVHLSVRGAELAADRLLRALGRTGPETSRRPRPHASSEAALS